MKRFLSILLLMLPMAVQAQVYTPNQHIISSTGTGYSNATPTDARSMFYDNNVFKYRDYQSTTEVLNYLNLAKYRTGHFFIFVHSGGTLSGGVWTGGTTTAYWFKNCTADSCLVPVFDAVSITTPSAPTYGELTDAATATLPTTNLPLRNSLDSLRKRTRRVFNVLDYGAIPGDGLSDTTAFKATVAALYAAGGGTMYLPWGMYTGGIVLPATNSNWITVNIEGESIPPAAFFGTIPAVLSLSNTGTIITNTNPADSGVIYVKKDAANSGNFNFITLSVKNLELRVADNPVIHGLNARKGAQIICRDLFVNNGLYNPNASLPTHGTAGIIVPAIDNGALNVLDNVTVTGFNTGILCGEHTSGTGEVTVASCLNAVVFPAANHASHFDRLGIYTSVYDLVWTGFHRVVIDELNLEQEGVAAGWQQNQYTIYDPSNYGRANIMGAVVTGFVGPTYTFPKNGGDSVFIKQIGTPWETSVTLTTPSPPTTPVTDDAANTFGWTDAGGKTYANAEYTTNAGSSWTNCTANPQTGIGNVNLAIGQVGVRYKAVSGVSNASSTLYNTVAFTATGGGPTNHAVAYSGGTVTESPAGTWTLGSGAHLVDVTNGVSSTTDFIYYATYANSTTTGSEYLGVDNSSTANDGWNSSTNVNAWQLSFIIAGGDLYVREAGATGTTGGAPVVSGAVTYASTTRVGIRVRNRSTTPVAEIVYSTNGGTSWTVLYTCTTVIPAATIYPKAVAIGSGSVITNPIMNY